MLGVGKYMPPENMLFFVALQKLLCMRRRKKSAVTITFQEKISDMKNCPADLYRHRSLKII
jgi:hypothetical protein